MRVLDTPGAFTIQQVGEYIDAIMEQSCPYSALENYQSLMLGAQNVQQNHLGAGKLLSRRSARAQAQQNRISSANKGIPDVFNNLRVLKDQTFLRNILTSTKSRTSKLSDYGLLTSSQSSKATTFSSFKDFRDKQGADSNFVVDDSSLDVASGFMQNNGSQTRIKVLTPTPTESEHCHSGSGRRTNSAYVYGRDANKLSVGAVESLISETDSVGYRTKTVTGSEKTGMTPVHVNYEDRNDAKISDVMNEIYRLTMQHPGVARSHEQTALPEINKDGGDTYESFVTTFSRESGNYTHSMAVTDITAQKDAQPRASPIHVHYERLAMTKDEEAAQEEVDSPKNLGRHVGQNGKLDFRYMMKFKTDSLKVPEVPSCLRRTRKPIWHGETNRKSRSDRSNSISENSTRALQKSELVATTPEMEFYKYKFPAPFNHDVSTPYRHTKPSNGVGGHEVEPTKIKMPTMATFISGQSSRESGSEYSKESKTNFDNVSSDAPSKEKYKQTQKSELKIVGITFSPSSAQTSTYGDVSDSRSCERSDGAEIESTTHEGQVNDNRNSSFGGLRPVYKTSMRSQRPGSRPVSQSSRKSRQNSRPRSRDMSLEIRSAPIGSRSSTPRTKLTRTPSPAQNGDPPDKSGNTETNDQNTDMKDSKSNQTPDGIGSNNENDVSDSDNVDIMPISANEALDDESLQRVTDNPHERDSPKTKHKSLGSGKKIKSPIVMFDLNAYNGFQHSKFRRDADSRRSNRTVYNDETKVKYLKVKVGESDVGN
jgi:hypothetical protein